MVNGQVNPKTVKKALNAIGVVVYNQRTIDLLKGHRGFLEDFIKKFAKQEEMNFVGMPHQITSTRTFCADVSAAEIWKDTNNADWKQTPTGLGTFDNVVPESAAKVKWDKDPNHWAYWASILEIGSANNMWRLDFKDINGTEFGNASVWHQSRLPALKIYQMNPAVQVRENGTIRLDIEFEGTSEAEVIPYGVHLFPQEIAIAIDQSAFVTAS